MRSSDRLAALAALAALVSAGTACDQARPYSDGGVPATSVETCTMCHGDASRDEPDALVRAAPPRAVGGGDGGAHLAHLHGGAVRGPLACAECHQVPAAAGHSNGTVDLAFGALARTGGATPSWNGASCAASYCHGTTLGAGGTNHAPSWAGGSGEAACGTCHGAPPPSHAAGSTDCHACHPGTVKADGTIDLAQGLHVDGAVEVNAHHPSGFDDPALHGPAAKTQGIAACQACHGADLDGGTSGVSCNACHGGSAWQSNCTWCHGTRVAAYTAADLSRAAPPLGTRGETATTTRAVGAHAVHLAGNALAKAIACTDCHATLPAGLAHVTGQPATVEFGAGARRGGAAPTWNGASCAASYCHGATLNAGGTNHAPAWTGGAAQAACGTCHGAPPPAPHAQSTACASCHPGYTATSVNLATHLDGAVQASVSCTSCHGSPPSTGQHQRSNHLNRSCGDCHPGYTASSANGATHQDGSVQTGNRITTYNASTRTCTNACHGSERW